MESGVRKILPRVQQTPQPAGAERDDPAVAAAEALRNGNGVVEVPRQDKSTGWKYSMEEEGPPKRKRQHIEDHHSPASQPLPSMRQLLPANAAHQQAAIATADQGPVRLIRTGNAAYAQQGVLRFLAPRTHREFPASISQDPRELSFACVEPELMEVFRHAYYLRHHVRHKRLSGEQWFDHIYFNDAYAIDNILRTWISRYEPGMLQYPASILYKQCLWIFFNRSIQASQSTAAFRHMVDDGLHFLRTFENELGATGDRSVLLVPIFLLGSTSFYAGQRQEIWTSLNRLDPSYSIDAVTHAARSLERIWEMMDDGRVGATWDWEKYQAHEYTMAQADRSLIELLWDPLAPPPQPQVPRVRSPEAYEFDAARFRAAPVPIPQQQPASAPPPYPDMPRPPREDAENEYSPPQHSRSPPRHHSTASIDADVMRVDSIPQENSHPDMAVSTGPRPFLAPPPPSSSTMHSANSDIIQVLHRKSNKSKSSVPPCPTCGKELKNPSDAQKHQLQHSKPFRCREPGCTRTQGFATENDLQRHRKSVHGASPRIGNKIGYICAACPDPSDGTTRKWWPRLDNFKAHIRRKHTDAEEESLIQASASARRPEDAYSEHSHYISHHHRSASQYDDESVPQRGYYRRHNHMQSLRSNSTNSAPVTPLHLQRRGGGDGEARSRSYDDARVGEVDSEDGTPKSEEFSDSGDAEREEDEGEGEGEGEGEEMDVTPPNEDEGGEEGDGDGEGEGEGE